MQLSIYITIFSMVFNSLKTSYNFIMNILWKFFRPTIFFGATIPSWDSGNSIIVFIRRNIVVINQQVLVARREFSFHNITQPDLFLKKGSTV